MLSCTKGILSKSLFIYCFIRICMVMPYDYLKSPSLLSLVNSRNFFFILQVAIRLYSTKSIDKIKYAIILISFAIDISFFMSSDILRIYSKKRIAVEISMTLLSIAWMIFLHPYYLKKNKIVDSESEKIEEVNLNNSLDSNTIGSK